jgi:hypothetical protein
VQLLPFCLQVTVKRAVDFLAKLSGFATLTLDALFVSPYYIGVDER